jgi:hypothetical protein
MKVKLPVVWTVKGVVEVEAESIEDAVKNFDGAAVAIPDKSEFVDDSLELDCFEPHVIEQCYN